MTTFKTALTACLLALTAITNLAQAGDSIKNVHYSIDSHDPVLLRGDADLWSHRNNPSKYTFSIEYKLVDQRKVVCTIWSSVEEPTGSTKFRFPTRSYVVYTAPSGKYIKGFRFGSNEAYRTYDYHWDRFEEYGTPGGLYYGIAMEMGPRGHYLGMSGDLWGSDYDMYWDFWGSIQIKVADINYSNLQYRGSRVSPSSFGRSFGR